jgi:glycosyltransferase involved in cell wall biosynthesis
VQPLVHVVIPVRDVGGWIDDALHSLRAQSLPNWRATVVDDGSLDSTPERVAAHAASDPRIRLLRQAALGLVPALRRGVEDGRGEPYLARFDGDDVLHRDRLAIQVGWMEARPDIDILDSRFELLGEKVEAGMLRYARWHDGIGDDLSFQREELVENPVCHPAVLLRRASLGVLGPLYRVGDFPEDYDLWLRARRAGLHFQKLPQRLVGWRERVDRTTRTDPRYREDAFFRLRWEHFRWRWLGRGLRFVVWGAKERGRPWIRALVQEGEPPVAVVDIDPRTIGRARQGVPVLPPEALSATRADLIVAAVGAPGARTLIEAAAARLGVPLVAVAGFGSAETVGIAPSPEGAVAGPAPRSGGA